MLSLALRIPEYRLFRLVGYPRPLPLNLTLSVTFRCNSRCRTCNVYEREAQELSLNEWEGVFRSLGKAPAWVTISGGEPILRKDLQELVMALYKTCRPSVINIPTNGLLTDRIVRTIAAIAGCCEQSRVVVNISMDDVGDRHDAIRGVPGSYEKALATLAGLKSIEASNLTVGIHTVISKFNITRIPEIYAHLRSLGSDSYITEIAEERVELGTIGAGITPSCEDYSTAVDFLMGELRRDRFNRLGRVTRILRLQYYQLARRILREEKQVIPCYAGFASAHIAPDGEVWTCCTRAESIGNLRTTDYDFGRIWNSEKAWSLRQRIKRGECHCPLANAGYTNMMFHLKTLLRAGLTLVRDHE